MKNKYLYLLSLLAFCFSDFTFALPSAPTDPAHPGSGQYSFQSRKESFQIAGRTVDAFIPIELEGSKSAPVIVFGHGQAIGLDAYQATFEHLARKGAVVLFPQYDTGFFDQDWRRMADDFNNLANESLRKYSSWLNPELLVYTGHSKGAYIALMAAGAPSSLNPKSLVLFAPAGYDSEYLSRMDSTIPLTLIWGEQDTIIKQPAVEEIFSRAPSRYKQFILVKSYRQGNLPADHFFLLSKSTFFGGRNGVSAFHYHGAWKWLLGATLDLQQKGGVTNTYLYGAEAATSGDTSFQHIIRRSW